MPLHPREASDLCADYPVVAVLGAAFERHLLASLLSAGPLTPESAAALSGSPLNATRQILDSLVEVGVVKVRQGSYDLTVTWRRALSTDHDRLSASLTRLREDMQRWMRLGEDGELAVQGESKEERMFRTGEGLERYLMSVQQFNQPMIEALAGQLRELIQTERVDRLADVGGGHGGYVLRLLEDHEGLSGDIYDLPATVKIARSMVSAHPRAGALRFIEADARELSQMDVRPYRLVMTNDLLHSFNRQDKERVLDGCVHLLEPGGWLVCTKFAFSASAPQRDNALFSMKLFLNTNRQGYLESEQELEDMCRSRNLVRVRSFRVENKIGILLRRSD